MSREFKIDGETVWVSPSWTINKKINAITTISFQVIDLGNLTEINCGDSILVKNGTDTVFAGIVKEVSDQELERGFLTYSITGQDNSAIAGRRLVAAAGENETAGYIVQYVILPYLAADGVTAGTIEVSMTISKYTFNYLSASQCLDQIKTITGLNWDIDDDKKLNFFSNNTIPAPWNLTNLVQHSGFTRKKSLDSYRNVQYIRAGKGKTAEQELEKPTPEPDGISRVFILNFKVATKPRIFIDSVEVAAVDIGIRGVDEGKEWYFKFDENTISQDSSETVLTNLNVLQVTYKGLFDIITLAENESQIADRITLEGGSGRYESILQEDSLTEENEALDFAQGLLNKYGEVLDKVQFKTNVAGLEAGQFLTITKALYSIDDVFLIESVNITPFSPTDLQYSISCLDGASIGGWEEYFKEMFRSQKTFTINENESLAKLTALDKEVLTITDTLTAVSGAPESRIGYMEIDNSEIG